MKIVKSESRPLDDDADFKVIKKLAEDQDWNATYKIGKKIYLASEAQTKYVSQILKFINIDKLKPLKLVVNCGNGAADQPLTPLQKRLKWRECRLKL